MTGTKPQTTGAAPPSVAEVTLRLKAVMDPELGDNIVDLGMAAVESISADGVVAIAMKLTIKGCPLRVQIKKDIESRLETHPGVSKVTIDWGEMTADERTAVMTRARWNAREQAPDTQIPLNTRILAIASGKGGVGKSSVTVNLAAALASVGHTVGVLDADIWGFSIPRMLGISDRLEARRIDGIEKPRMIPNERVVGKGLLKVVSTGMLVEDESTALMWRGLMLTKAVEQFLNDVHWGELDYLLIDMPPGTGDVQMGLARMLPRTDLVIVTTPSVSAQKVALLKLETVLALIDGWTDEVSALAAGDRLPAIEQLRETLRRRRASAAPAQQLFSSMLGLQVSPKLTREASAFWKKIREVKSISERDQIWSGLLPTADDLLDPEKFLASTSIPDDLSGLAE